MSKAWKVTRPVWHIRPSKLKLVFFYRIYGLVLLLTMAIGLLWNWWMADTHSYAILMTTNSMGEALPEAIMVILAIPAWVLISYDVLKMAISQGFPQ